MRQASDSLYCLVMTMHTAAEASTALAIALSVLPCILSTSIHVA